MNPSDFLPLHTVRSDSADWRAAVIAIHADDGLATLTDELAHFTEIEAVLEPLAAALFNLAAAGEDVSLDEVNGELGLVDSTRPDGFDPASRVRPYLERALEDGEALHDIGMHALLLLHHAARAAAARAEWTKWEAAVPDDLEPGAVNMDVDGAARHLARQLLKQYPYLTPEEAALAAILGFRMAGLKTDRSIYRYALDGARAGFADHAGHLRWEERRKAAAAEDVADIFNGAAS